jgi:hypothetical protein
VAVRLEQAARREVQPVVGVVVAVRRVAAPRVAQLLQRVADRQQEALHRAVDVAAVDAAADKRLRPAQPTRRC